ncbi:MAG TPA: copper homeostasis periplasmic binding protein CopC [Caulobacteraceae bacterium]
MKPRLATKSVIALTSALALVAAASQADAHARLVGATPAANSAIASPKQVVLHFSETLVPKFSSFDLMKADGTKVSIAASVPAKDRKSVVGMVSAPLASGSYMVMWHVAAADDGHRTKGAFNFTVH